MKKTLLTLLAACTAVCANGNDLLGVTHVDVKDDLFVSFTNSKGEYDLNTEEQQRTLGMDMIIAGIFTDKQGWYQQIPGDNRSYIGIERLDAPSRAYAFSCAGAYPSGSVTGDYQFVFNRADPESAIKDAVIPNNEEYKYTTVKGNPVTFTRQYLENALAGGKKAAIALLRTPESDRDDMLAVSIWTGTDPETGEHTFEDFVVTCEVSAVGDDSAVKGVAYDPQRLSGAFYFVAKHKDSHYGVDDIVAVNHYILAGDIPHPTPEPTTATLSLLALAALAARRRRH